MTKYRKRNRRKRRRDKVDKTKICPVNVWTSEKCNDCGVTDEEIEDLMRAPGAVMLFFNEKGEVEAKISAVGVQKKK